MKNQQRKEFLYKIIDFILNEKIKPKLIKCLWIAIYKIFIIKGLDEFKMIEPKIKCNFISITLDNCHRIKDFREESRVAQYRDKLMNSEIGYFAEHNGKIIGSVWATINKTTMPKVVQTFKTIMYNEALIHDNVVSENFRGLRVGPFMESNMFSILLKEYKVSRLIADINVRNDAVSRMFNTLGVNVDHKMLYIALFGQPILKLMLRK